MEAKLFRNYPDIVTVDQLWEMLNIGKNTAYSLLQNGHIKAFRIGRTYKIPLRNVIEFMNR